MTRTRLVLLPLLILAAALGVTWALWNHERQAARHELLTQFDFSLGDAVSRIEQRMGTYELLLRGVQSLFAASGNVDRDAFRAYVGTLNLDANFSGIQAIGITVKPSSSVRKMRPDQRQPPTPLRCVTPVSVIAVMRQPSVRRRGSGPGHRNSRASS